MRSASPLVDALPIVSVGVIWLENAPRAAKNRMSCRPWPSDRGYPAVAETMTDAISWER